MCKMIFTAPAEPSRFASRLLHHGVIKLAVNPVQPTSSHTISHRLPAIFAMT
jgi:hypothetical protein